MGLLVLATSLLWGCVAMKPAWQSQFDSAAMECGGKYTNQDLVWARCMAQAEEILRSAPGVYQDLITLRQTSRIAIASKVERKEISREQAGAEMAQVMSYVASEAQRRDSGQQAANAQMLQAAAGIMVANRPPPFYTPPQQGGPTPMALPPPMPAPTPTASGASGGVGPLYTPPPLTPPPPRQVVRCSNNAVGVSCY